jgi:hypothetical protein
MQRNTSTWVYFLSLLVGIAMTVALLPACGGGGSGSCNSELNEDPEAEEGCELEEVGEEEDDADLELVTEFREETGDPEELFSEESAEIAECGNFGCAEDM